MIYSQTKDAIRRRASRSILRLKKTIPCTQCGAIFIHPFRVLSEKATCSQECLEKRKLKERIEFNKRVSIYRRARPKPQKKILTEEEVIIKSMYQSLLCHRRRYDREIIIICRGCNKEFHAEHGKKKYCSKECNKNTVRPILAARKRTPEERAKRNKFLRNKIKNNPQFRLRCLVSKQIWRALKRIGKSKNDSVVKHLPYSIPQLKAHIESFFNNSNGYTWENHGSIWHIDHIIPQSFFKYESLDSKSFRDCWALSNLKPLGRSENISKGNRRTWFFDENKQGTFL